MSLSALVGLRVIRPRAAARGDWEMIVNRLIAGLLILAFDIFGPGKGMHGARAPLLAVLVYLFLGLLVAAHLLSGLRGRDGRRLTALFLDLGAISYEMFQGGAGTAWLYPAYLWVIFGNGFRFGANFLVLAMSVGTLMFGTLALLSPFWHAQPWLSGGLLVGLVIVPLYALTLIRKLSQARLQAEQANQAKSLFLASVSHELRTPLNAIIGMGALLSRGALNTEQRDMTQTIMTAARTLLGSIDSILDLSRIEAGKMPELRVEFDLAESLAQLRRLVLAQAAAKSLHLGIFVAARVPLRLFGDDRRLREILLNLVANAIKFTRAGGVTIAVDLASDSGPTARLRFEVTDTGIGIAPDARDRIFENFTQADPTILDRFGGTGLGLSITRQSVKLLGGEIGVDSTVGVGSTFWFELDFAHQRQPVAGTEAFVGMRALLLASDPKIAAPIVGRLNELGVQVDLMDAQSDHRASLRHIPTLPGDAVLAFLPLEDTEASGSGLLADLPLVAVSNEARVGTPDAEARRLYLTLLSPPISEEHLITALSLVRSRLASPVVALIDQAPLPAAHHGLRILASDDNVTNRRVLERILQGAGHTVTLVSDGEAAIDLMTEQQDPELRRQGEPFDVAIMDVNMPGMNGIEVVKHYRVASLGLPRLPIIGLTADGTAQTRQRCLDAGMDACLTKPVEPAKLIATIDSVVAASVAADAASLPARVAAQHPSVAEIKAHPRFRVAATVVVDPKMIRGLLDLGGKEFLNEVIRDYLAESAQGYARLQAAAAASDVLGFRAQAHAMRSSAANLGAVELCRLCQPWETISADDLARSGASHLRRLQAECDRVEATLLNWEARGLARN
jgi:two-component system sensor histidine kinase RpfC